MSPRAIRILTNLSPLFAVLAIVPIASGADVSAPSSSRSTKVQLVILATQTLGCPHQDVDRVIEVFQRGIAATPGKPVSFPKPIVVVLYPSVDWDAVFKELGNADIDTETTLVFYYKGHALMDVNPRRLEPGQPAATHKLILDYTREGYILPREKLLGRLCEMTPRPRFTAILTECCSTAVNGIPSKAQLMGPPDDEGLFEDLFLVPSGLVDITSSTYTFDRTTGKEVDEASMSPLEGGLFTRAFNHLLTRNRPKTALGVKAAERMTWQRFFPALRDQTNRNYHAFREARLKNEDLLPPLSAGDKATLSAQLTQTPVCNTYPSDETCKKK